MVITNLTAAPQFQSTVRCYERRQPLQSEVTLVVFDVAHRCTCRIYYEGRLALIKGYKSIKQDPSDTLSELNSSNYGRVAVVHILDAPRLYRERTTESSYLGFYGNDNFFSSTYTSSSRRVTVTF